MLKVIAAAVLLATTTGAAHAETKTPAQRFAAAAALQARFAPAHLSDPVRYFPEPPPTGDASARQDFKDLEAAMDAFGTPAFPVDGFATFTTVCVPLLQLRQHYIMAGADDVPGFAANPGLASPQIQALENANLVKYQDVLTALATENTKCTALHMSFDAQVWDSWGPAERTAARLDGIHKLRAGNAKGLLSGAQSATREVFSKANRDLLINTEATYADAFASTLPVADRQAVKAQIDQAAPGLATAYPAQYAVIAKALARTDCTGLCTVP